ncbi:MAG: hypothetical protein QM831_43500 [Kofleriaceae bacterium]
MRIDRSGFFAAVAALAACEKGAPPEPKPAPIKVEPKPAIAAVERFTPPPEHIAPPPPIPQPEQPKPVHRKPSIKNWFHSLSTANREAVLGACEERAERSCQESLRSIMPKIVERPDTPIEPPPPQVEEPDRVASLPKDKVAQYCKEDFTPPTCETPLVIAFDQQPVAFAASQADAFAFVPGNPMTTDWPTSATPWIALDLDGDGAITSGAELFGSSTVLPNGGHAANGFLALAPLDANGDGVLDARDPMFAKLVLWSDRNGDHRSEPSELRPLSELVTRIDLAYSLDARCNDRDDCEGERGTLRWRDATGVEHVGAVVDVYVAKK